MTLNFIHFTIQEFLAAHYISHFPPNEELEMIKANFWSDIHFNMFSIYMSLTKGQQPAFKLFLSGGNRATTTISQEFLKDQLKCLRLYYWFNKASDHSMCNTIEQAKIFNCKAINLQGIKLSAGDMECISLFLTSSFNKEWVELNLMDCYILDRGLNNLHRGLRHSNTITINKLWLSNSLLTTQSSSLISDIVIKYKVKMLLISANYTVGENRQLYMMLNDPCSTLEKLYMINTKLSSRGASYLFEALKDNDKLKELIITINAITDDACDAITTALERNSCLVTLKMHDNLLSTETVTNIVKCLEVNNTLQFLHLPDCHQKIISCVYKKLLTRGEKAGGVK